MKSWLTAISDELINRVDKVPKDWKTSLQISEEIKKSHSHTMNLLRRLLIANKAEMKCFMVLRNNRTYPVPHYQILP